MYNILFKITLAAGIGVLLWVLLAYTDQTDSDQSAVFLSMDETMSPSATDEVLPISDKTDATLVPISRVDERVTRKPFGILIDPETSLVQPERFRGYHTGTDFEVFPEEAEAEVYIRNESMSRRYHQALLMSCRLWCRHRLVLGMIRYSRTDAKRRRY